MILYLGWTLGDRVSQRAESCAIKTTIGKSHEPRHPKFNATATTNIHPSQRPHYGFKYGFLE